MNVSARSALMSGMALATAGAVAFAPAVSPIAPNFARPAAHEFTQLPVRTADVQLTGAIVDLVTNATVAFIDLYYPIRDAGQRAIDLANRIVYNPFIQVWPITAWMSQINAAWTLGTGILDDTPPGAGAIQLLVDTVQIPQDVLNGSSVRTEISDLVDQSLNTLNYSAAYAINYGFYQLAYFTWIWIKPITPPLFPLLPSSVEFKLPGFLTPEAPSDPAELSTADFSALPTARGLGVGGIPIAGPDAVAEVVGKLADNVTSSLDRAADCNAGLAEAVGSVPQLLPKGVVAAQGKIRGTNVGTATGITAATAAGDRKTVRETGLPSAITKGLAADAKKTVRGIAEARKHIENSHGDRSNLSGRASGTPRRVNTPPS